MAESNVDKIIEKATEMLKNQYKSNAEKYFKRLDTQQIENFEDILLKNNKDKLVLGLFSKDKEITDKIYSNIQDKEGAINVFRNKDALIINIHGSKDGKVVYRGKAYDPLKIIQTLEDAKLIPEDINNIYTMSCYGGLQKPGVTKKGVPFQSAHTTKSPIQGGSGYTSETTLFILNKQSGDFTENFKEHILNSVRANGRHGLDIDLIASDEEIRKALWPLERQKRIKAYKEAREKAINKYSDIKDTQKEIKRLSYISEHKYLKPIEQKRLDIKLPDRIIELQQNDLPKLLGDLKDLYKDFKTEESLIKKYELKQTRGTILAKPIDASESVDTLEKNDLDIDYTSAEYKKFLDDQWLSKFNADDIKSISSTNERISLMAKVNMGIDVKYSLPNMLMLTEDKNLNSFMYSFLTEGAEDLYAFRQKDALFLFGHGSQDGKIIYRRNMFEPKEIIEALENDNLIPLDIKKIYTLNCFGGKQEKFYTKNNIPVESGHTSYKPIASLYTGQKTGEGKAIIMFETATNENSNLSATLQQHLLNAKEAKAETAIPKDKLDEALEKISSTKKTIWNDATIESMEYTKDFTDFKTWLNIKKTLENTDEIYKELENGLKNKLNIAIPEKLREEILEETKKIIETYSKLRYNEVAKFRTVFINRHKKVANYLQKQAAKHNDKNLFKSRDVIDIINKKYGVYSKKFLKEIPLTKIEEKMLRPILNILEKIPEEISNKILKELGNDAEVELEIQKHVSSKRFSKIYQDNLNTSRKKYTPKKGPKLKKQEIPQEKIDRWLYPEKYETNNDAIQKINKYTPRRGPKLKETPKKMPTKKITEAASDAINKIPTAGKVGIAMAVLGLGAGIYALGSRDKEEKKKEEKHKQKPEYQIHVADTRPARYTNNMMYSAYAQQMAKDISTYRYGKKMTGFV